MKKNDVSSITYNPSRQESIESGAVMLIITALAAYAAWRWQFGIIAVVCFIGFVIISVVAVYYTLRDPSFVTYATIDRDGVHISFKGKDPPIFIPWSNDVYINICIRNDHGFIGRTSRDMVLCLSNRDINDELVKYDDSINLSHKLPSDINEQWVLFLVTDVTFMCKRAAKRVRAFKDAANNQA